MLPLISPVGGGGGEEAGVPGGGSSTISKWRAAAVAARNEDGPAHGVPLVPEHLRKTQIGPSVKVTPAESYLEAQEL